MLRLLRYKVLPQLSYLSNKDEKLASHLPRKDNNLKEDLDFRNLTPEVQVPSKPEIHQEDSSSFDDSKQSSLSGIDAMTSLLNKMKK